MYDTTYYSDFDTILGTFFGMFIGVFIFIMIFALIVGILVIIGKWNILKKGGEEGWKSLIPIYSTYTMCKLVGVNPYWVLITIAGWFLSSIPLVNLVSAVASIYFTILLNVSIAKAFGKDTGFAIGLIFLPYIFYPILGLGNKEFVGKNPMEDIIFKNTNQQSNTNNQNIQNNNVSETQNEKNETINQQELQNKEQSETIFCSNCGSNINKEDIFCTNCGTKRK